MRVLSEIFVAQRRKGGDPGGLEHSRDFPTIVLLGPGRYNLVQCVFILFAQGGCFEAWVVSEGWISYHTAKRAPFFFSAYRNRHPIIVARRPVAFMRRHHAVAIALPLRLAASHLVLQ